MSFSYIIIGEAIHKLPAEFLERHSDIKWDEFVGMRNVLVHQYFGINLKILWDTYKDKDLEKVKKVVEAEIRLLEQN